MRALSLLLVALSASTLGCGSSSDGGGSGGAGGDSTGTTQSTSSHPSASTGSDMSCDGGVGAPCYSGDPITENIGQCKDGVTVCKNTSVVCVGEVLPTTEACDGVDNNCDGTIDEGCSCIDMTTQPCWSGDPTTRNVGACQDGHQTCVGGQWAPACDGQVLPTAEICNGVDDNCDGTVDEGDPGSGVACNTGLPGGCGDGVVHCIGGAPICVPNANGAACSTGLPGICAAGTSDCSSGSFVCNQNQAAAAEACDGLDNDCNGVVDDGVGSACDTGQPGQCAAGTLACNGAGGFVCNANQGPTGEICDGINNDCNGVVDDGQCCFCECCF